MDDGAVLRKLDAVTVNVSDLDLGLAFYRDRLGLKLKWRNDSLSQVGLQLPESDTEVVLTTTLGYEPNWLVESVERAAAVFRDAGGDVLAEPFDIPVGRVAVVSDPFGNVLVLLDLSKGRYEVNAQGDVIGVNHPD